MISKTLNTKQKTKDRTTRIPLKSGSGLRCSGMVSISCYNSDIRRVTLVTNLAISHAWRKDGDLPTTNGAYQMCGHGGGSRSQYSSNQSAVSFRLCHNYYETLY